MAKICDRSPCDGLLGALGNYIFCSPDKDGFFIIVTVKDSGTEVSIEYCPFCGTRLEEVPEAVVEKFIRSRRRRRTTLPRGSAS